MCQTACCWGDKLAFLDLKVGNLSFCSAWQNSHRHLCSNRLWGTALPLRWGQMLMYLRWSLDFFNSEILKMFWNWFLTKTLHSGTRPVYRAELYLSLTWEDSTLLQTCSVLWTGLFAPHTEIDNHCYNYFHTLIYNTLVRLICLNLVIYSQICSEITLTKINSFLREYLVKCMSVQEALLRVMNVVSWPCFCLLASIENSSCKWRWGYKDANVTKHWSLRCSCTQIYLITKMVLPGSEGGFPKSSPDWWRIDNYAITENWNTAS